MERGVPECSSRWEHYRHPLPNSFVPHSLPSPFSLRCEWRGFGIDSRLGGALRAPPPQFARSSLIALPLLASLRRERVLGSFQIRWNATGNTPHTRSSVGSCGRVGSRQECRTTGSLRNPPFSLRWVRSGGFAGRVGSRQECRDYGPHITLSVLASLCKERGLGSLLNRGLVTRSPPSAPPTPEVRGF